MLLPWFFKFCIEKHLDVKPECLIKFYYVFN